MFYLTANQEINEAKLLEYLPAYLKKILRKQFEGKYLSKYKARWNYGYRVASAVRYALSRLDGQNVYYSSWNQRLFTEASYQNIQLGSFYFANIEAIFNETAKLFEIVFYIFSPPFDKEEDGYRINFMWNPKEKLEPKGSQLLLFE